MWIIKWAVIVLAVIVLLAVLVVLAGQLGLWRGRPPHGMGVNDGKLKRPSSTPNSVHSQAELWPGHAQLEYARIAPLALKGDGATTIARLKALLQAMPGVQIVDSRADYVYATCQTRLMKFVDDIEFWFDAQAGVVQVRSSSRVGRNDFGVNRARVEALRAALAAS